MMVIVDASSVAFTQSCVQESCDLEIKSNATRENRYPEQDWLFVARPKIGFLHNDRNFKAGEQNYLKIGAIKQQLMTGATGKRQNAFIDTMITDCSEC